MWIVTTSEVAKSSSLSTGVTPTARASSGSRWRLQAATSIPNACPTAATGVPIPPRPTTPSRRPLRSAPTVCCQPPSRSRRSSSGTWRTAARISAQVISTVAALSRTPPVPDTVIPAACAAATSMAAFAGPVVTSRRRLGRRSSTSAGKAVRSRMTTSASKGSSAATTSSGPPRCSWNVVISAPRPSVTRCHAALCRATCW